MKKSKGKNVLNNKENHIQFQVRAKTALSINYLYVLQNFEVFYFLTE